MSLRQQSDNVILQRSAAAGSGDVSGPASSTDNAIARFNGTTGKAIQNSGITIDDSDVMSGATLASPILTTPTFDLTQDYAVASRANSFTLQGQTTGTESAIELYSNDGDGTDDIHLRLVGVGTPSDITNAEYLDVEYDAAGTQFLIYSQKTGTGTVRPISIMTDGNTDQLKFNIDGTCSFSGAVTGTTLTTPTIGDFTNATHDHSNTAGGGTISHSNLTNLAWTSSTHTGTATRLAGFDGTGAASEYTMNGTGTEIPTTNSPTFTNITVNGTTTTINTTTTTVDGGITVDNTLWNADKLVTTTGNAFGITATDAAINMVTGTGAADDFTINTTGLVYEGDTGNVGIGTSSPTYAIDAYSASSSVIIGMDGVDQYRVGLSLRNNYSGTQSDWFLVAAGGQSNWGTTNGNFIIRDDRNNSTAIEFEQGAGGTSGALYIDSDSNVGIGTSSPGVTLDVNSGGINMGMAVRSTDTGAAIGFADNTTTLDGGIYPYVAIGAVGDDLILSTSNAEKVRIDSSGNVGIGTDSPSSVLSIKSDVNNNINNGILFEAADSTDRLIQIYENSVGESYMSFHQADTIKNVIRSNGVSYFNGGDIGIGTSSPYAQFDVRASAGGVMSLTTSDSSVTSGDVLGTIQFAAPNEGSPDGNAVAASIHAEASDTFLPTQNGCDLVFSVGESAAAEEMMRINKFGNVGIGIDSIDAGIKLHIQSSVSADLRLKTENTGTSATFGALQFGSSNDPQLATIRGIADGATDNGALVFLTEATGEAIEEKMRISSTGNVGIGLEPTVNMDGLSIEAGLLTLKERATPTADSGYAKLYSKTDNFGYIQDGSGVEKKIMTSTYACLYVSSSSATTISSSSTPVLVAGTTTEVTSTSDITVSSAGRLTYTGATTRRFKADAGISFESAGNNNDYVFYLAKNGTVIGSSAQQNFIGTGSERKVIPLTCMPELAQNDYLEVYVENITDTDNCTIDYMNFNILAIG